MRPPDFWQLTEGRDAAPMLRTLLTPLSWLYQAAGARRIANTPGEKVSVPVISVGNLTMGGTGKTPLVRLIRQKLVDAGVNAFALSRGYGGQVSGPLRVDPSVHTAREVGDEPIVLASDGSMMVARDRVAGARAAIAAGAQALVLDDGHQNPMLAKDLRIVVIDAKATFGNGRVFPAGPLREPVRAGLQRADTVILMRAGPEEIGMPTPWLPWHGPVLEAWLKPANAAPPGPLVAFCGIGMPQKFAATLKSLGADVTDLIPFPDHHPFLTTELARLADLASHRGARLITTEKDAARLPPAFRQTVDVLRVATEVAEPEALAGLLAPIIASAHRPIDSAANRA